MLLTLLAVLSAFLPVGETGAAQGLLSQNGSTLKDLDTGLVWAADADTPSFMNCSGGKKTWQEAVNYVQCLNANGYLGQSDWRLPSVKELTTLFKAPPKGMSSTVAMQKLKEYGFKITHPSSYWSSDTPTNEIALVVDVLATGRVLVVGRSSTMNVWPVRGGR